MSRAVNASIESHDLKLAKNWLDRSDVAMDLNPQLMRERERYLTLTGSYEESAALGYKVLEKLPKDPEAPVYLGYDLVFLGKYKEGACDRREVHAGSAQGQRPSADRRVTRIGSWDSWMMQCRILPTHWNVIPLWPRDTWTAGTF